MRAACIKHVYIGMAIILSIGVGFYLNSPAKADTPPIQQWAQRFTVAGSASTVWSSRSIAVDGSGNAYVTGSASNGSNMDMVTIKYSPAGAEQWVRWYDHTGNSQDAAWAVAVDTTGNAYVTGYGFNSDTNLDMITLKYGPDGTRLWVQAYDNGGQREAGKAIALDNQGNVYVTGLGDTSTGFNYLTVKYDAAGNLQWDSYYDGPRSADAASAIAVDTAGNVYVAGESLNAGGNSDYATVKYRGIDGEPVWETRYNGPDDGDDYASAIAVDASGNAYVTGTSNNKIPTTAYYATLKYSGADGSELWEARYGGPGGGSNGASGLAVDSGGNAFVTGFSCNADGKQDMCTIKYNSAGAQQWVARYIGPANLNAGANAIAMDGSGNVHITGRSKNVGGRYDYTTVKYSNGGTELWAVRYDGPAGLEDSAKGIAVRGSDVYVTGQSKNAGDKYDYATVKYAQSSSIAGISPSNGTQGQCPLNFTITGSNFAGTTAVGFGAGITVDNFTIDNPSQITAVICISGSAVAGPRSITVTTPLDTVTLASGFTVNELPGQLPVGTGTSPHSSPAVTAPATPGPPMVNPVILARTASLSATTVAPGTPVTLTADIANKSAANGSKNIRVYVNGQLETSKGVSVNSGGSAQVDFSITRSEPGTYTVYVDGINAGSFKVDQVTPDTILFISGSLVLFALVVGVIYMTRRTAFL